MARGFWQVVDDVLAFVAAPASRTSAELLRLVRLLDELAATLPPWDGEPPAHDDDPPQRDAGARREALCARFPDFGFYRVVEPAEPDDGSDDGVVTLGDAVDDLLDITSDLLDAQWYREHGRAGDGERCAGEMFRYHWGRHLRDLQSYLQRRQVEARG